MPEQCVEIIALLSDYLDRDLPPEGCAAVQSHLQTCTACAQAAEDLQKTVGLCRKYRADESPRPMPREKREELREAFQRVLTAMRDR